MTRMPTVFISHGSPMLAIQDSPARRFLQGYGATLGRPTAVLMLSAHWLTARPTLSLASDPETIHDFGGFPDALYAIRYPAPGAPALAEEAAALLEQSGISVERAPERGLDHGAWVPLSLMYPDADIPVTQLSLQPHLGTEHHYRVGQALAPLRERGVLIVGSGSLTHNLAEYFGRPGDDRVPDWVSRFADWMHDTLAGGRIDDALHYRERAPFAARNHPTDEHLLALYPVLGAGGEHATVRRVHASYDGVIAMDNYEVG